jgi:hypothetical protein
VHAPRLLWSSSSLTEGMSGERESRNGQSVNFDRARVDFSSLPAAHALLRQHDSTDAPFYYNTPSSQKLGALSSAHFVKLREALLHLRVYTDAFELVDTHREGYEI